ncbi:MAG: hypothetical protein LC635_03460 [Pseudonocardiaceae bacterium]|nr:hypothetical protein [Pseudonocardiaceae bacterium]
MADKSSPNRKTTAMGWTRNIRIPDQTSKASPALARLNNLLHMVHLGNTSNDIWHSTWNGSQWSRNVRIPDQTSKAAQRKDILITGLGSPSAGPR